MFYIYRGIPFWIESVQPLQSTEIVVKIAPTYNPFQRIVASVYDGSPLLTNQPNKKPFCFAPNKRF